MPLTRSEVGDMKDVMLQISIDGRVHRIRQDWAAGLPGKITDIYDLALLRAEHELRTAELLGPLPQLRLFTDETAAA